MPALDQSQVELRIPTAYVDGYAKAISASESLATNYIKHTTIGDPVLDPIMDELAELEPSKLHKFVEAGIMQQEDLCEAPEALREFFDNLGTPDWLDFEAFRPGVSAFHGNTQHILLAFICGVLVEGFATLISKSFAITGRVVHTHRRLKQNNRQLVEIFFPGGLHRDGDGFRLSIRIRFVHARIRQLLRNSEEWDGAAWGAPISAAHLGYAISVFSMRLLQYSVLVGARFDQEARDSILDVWRYAGHVMGIPESILYTNGKMASELYEIGRLCEPPPDEDSVLMANALINSAPLIAGITDPKERRSLTGLAFRLSSALIGKELAKGLGYPKSAGIGTLFLYRLDQRVRALLKAAQIARSENFSLLLQISAFDDSGMSYRLPDHVKHVKSSDW